jgi:uncharacterized repeat protein (TIGR01451 family)
MNTTGRFRKLGPALCLIAGLAAFGSGFAQDRGALEVTNSVFQEVQVTAPDGTVATKLVPALKAVPGDEVVYEISYRNTGSDVATDIAIDNPLPQALTFVEAATAPTAVSVDGGKRFGNLADLTVTGADGEARVAQPSDITNLRWVVSRLAPGATGKVTFRARVK